MTVSHFSPHPAISRGLGRRVSKHGPRSNCALAGSAGPPNHSISAAVLVVARMNRTAMRTDAQWCHYRCGSVVIRCTGAGRLPEPAPQRGCVHGCCWIGLGACGRFRGQLGGSRLRSTALPDQKSTSCVLPLCFFVCLRWCGQNNAKSNT